MPHHYCTACQDILSAAATAPSMPALTDLDSTIPSRSCIPRQQRSTRDTAPAVRLKGRTNGLRAYAPSTAVTGTIQILVLGAIPPLTRARATDRTLGIDRWTVIAYPPPTVAKRVNCLVQRLEASR